MYILSVCCYLYILSVCCYIYVYPICLLLYVRKHIIQWKNMFINWPGLVQHKDIYATLIEVIEPINPWQRSAHSTEIINSYTHKKASKPWWECLLTWKNEEGKSLIMTTTVAKSTMGIKLQILLNLKHWILYFRRHPNINMWEGELDLKDWIGGKKTREKKLIVWTEFNRI